MIHHLAPAGGTVAAYRNPAKSRLRLVANVEHHTPIGKLDWNSFTRIDRMGMGDHDLSGLPRPAIIVAVDDRDAGGPVRMSTCSGRAPDGDKQAAVI